MDINQFADPKFYQSLIAAAVLTSIVTQAVKVTFRRWKGDEWRWRDPALYVIVYVVALVILFAGRRINAIGLTVSEGWLIIVQAIIVGALAIGGFKTVQEIWQRVGGNRAGGDIITVGNVNHGNVAVGDDAEVDR